MVVSGVGGGSDKRRRRDWEIQAIAMACERELGPEQGHHREEGGALEQVPMADADHGVSLPLTGTDAIDPSQSLARPRGWRGTDVVGEDGTAADLARRRALATTDTELKLIASAATIGLSKIPNAG